MLGGVSVSRVRSFTMMTKAWRPTKSDTTRGHHHQAITQRSFGGVPPRHMGGTPPPAILIISDGPLWNDGACQVMHASTWGSVPWYRKSRRASNIGKLRKNPLHYPYSYDLILPILQASTGRGMSSPASPIRSSYSTDTCWQLKVRD